AWGRAPFQSPFANIGEAMPNIARAGLAGDHRLDGEVHRLGQVARDIADAAMFAASDIVDAATGARVRESQHKCVGDIAHMDEVATLVAVLENDWGRAVAKPRCEYRQNASVWIGESLTGAVYIPQ